LTVSFLQANSSSLVCRQPAHLIASFFYYVTKRDNRSFYHRIFYFGDSVNTVCGLFNDVVSSSHDVTLDDTTINE
jgi:hypothetical protein